MNRINLTTIVALIAFSAAFLQAGESYCPPAKDTWCKQPVCCDPTGYVFGYVGYTFGSDADYTVTGGGSGQLDFDGGFSFGGGAGIYSDLFCGTRFEIEGIYYDDDFDISNGGGTGEFERYGIMVNGLKEIPLGCITGYVGGGIGYTWNEITINGAGGGTDDDGAFAYQLIIGGDLPVTDCISLFAQYKLFGVSDTSYFGNVNVDQYFTHSINVGARYSF